MKSTRRQVEAAHQRALFKWAQYAAAQQPELALLYAIPNGGLRDARTAAMLRAEGVKPGVPDMCLPVARKGFHGLYIELKAPGGGTALLQKEWLRRLANEGYKTAVSYGWEQARDVLRAYLAA